MERITEANYKKNELLLLKTAQNEFYFIFLIGHAANRETIGKILK